MALDWNKVIEEGHKVGKPFIIEGMKKGIAKIDGIVAESGTIADDLLWQDLKESFQEPCNP